MKPIEDEKYYNVNTVFTILETDHINTDILQDDDVEIIYHVKSNDADWDHLQELKFLNAVYLRAYPILISYHVKHVPDTSKRGYHIVYHVYKGCNEFKTLVKLFKNELRLSGVLAKTDVHGKTYDELPFPIKRRFMSDKMAVYKILGNVSTAGIADNHMITHDDLVNILNLD